MKNKKGFLKVQCDYLQTQGTNKTKYRKNSKNWDTLNYHRDCPTNGIVAFYSAILRSKRFRQNNKQSRH